MIWGAEYPASNDGQVIIIVPEETQGSPLDVEGIELDLSPEEIVELIHEGKKYG